MRTRAGKGNRNEIGGKGMEAAGAGGKGRPGNRAETRIGVEEETGRECEW